MSTAYAAATSSSALSGISHLKTTEASTTTSFSDGPGRARRPSLRVLQEPGESAPDLRIVQRPADALRLCKCGSTEKRASGFSRLARRGVDRTKVHLRQRDEYLWHIQSISGYSLCREGA